MNEGKAKKDYQRLEFMGDAVFQIVSAELIFRRYCLFRSPRAKKHYTMFVVRSKTLSTFCLPISKKLLYHTSLLPLFMGFSRNLVV